MVLPLRTLHFSSRFEFTRPCAEFGCRFKANTLVRIEFLVQRAGLTHGRGVRHVALRRNGNARWKEDLVADALAAKFSNPALPTALNEYALDFWQRSILFLDILRQRGDTLPRPVNYSLLRVIPPAGVEIDDRKRPVMVIDPRAG